jgi:phosphatidylserine decarboxylase
LEEIFARSLKIGQRSINGTFCSPADGVLVRSSILQEGQEDMAVQCKGQDYSLGELVYGKSKINYETKLGSYSTIYLAPHNYHRVHSPCSGQIRMIRYIPGELWPVNNWACFRVPMLFLRNERLVFEIDLGDGGIVYVVMVGALNVGRIRTHLLDNFVTNSLKRQLYHGINEFKKIEPVPIKVGDELGVFLLGSTVIVVLNKEASKRYPLLQNDSKRNIIVGESLLRDS